MTERWFLKIDGIVGESKDARHKDEIDVMSWSFGVANSGTAAGSGGGGRAGKATFQDLHFVTKISKASPKLFLSCATGTHHKAATLSGSQAAGKSAGDFLTYKLTDVQVTSVHHGDTGADAPIEQFSLDYGRFEISFTAPGEPPVTAGIDVKAGKKV